MLPKTPPPVYDSPKLSSAAGGMNVIAIASQKGGAGKSTFALNLAVLAEEAGTPTLIIDTDAQGSLAVWRKLRKARTPLLVQCRADEVEEVLQTVREHRLVEWVFIDGPPQNNADIATMMRAATLVLIPTRPAIFDVASAAATVVMARKVNRPFFIALNAVPARRGVTDAPVVINARRTFGEIGAPVWHGAVAQRAAYVNSLASGQAVTELEASGPAAEEMRLLWFDLKRSVLAMAERQAAG
jgi:chromosome partitioning protein